MLKLKQKGGENVKVEFLFDGVDIRVSSKSNQEYATIFGRELTEDGTPKIKQSSFITFQPTVVEATKKLEAGTIVLLDLRITQATVQGIEV